MLHITKKSAMWSLLLGHSVVFVSRLHNTLHKTLSIIWL